MGIKQIQLLGRVFLTFNIELVTGLHIGGSDVGIEIGGVDKTIIRDKLTNRPYIPGSSLRGKTRSLLEKYRGLPQNKRVGQSTIHSCSQDADYAGCDICQVFGVPGEEKFGTPTRLVVRDIALTEKSVKDLERAKTDLPYSEVKTEVSIDRVTSAANPRQMERVPAGAVFGQAELVYSIYTGDDCNPTADIERLATVIEGLALLEDDYLGGLGSRGSGKIKLTDIAVFMRSGRPYTAAPVQLTPQRELASVAELSAALSGVQASIRQQLSL